MKSLLSFLIISCFFAAGWLSAAEAPRPNVLLILADDLGFADLGCYGGEISTPHLDSLAASGLRFTQFYNTSRCWPTRAALLTGDYAQTVRRDDLPGVPSGGGTKGKRPEWAALLPELLAPVGYRSYHTGKWHIDGLPLANGFEHSYYVEDQGRYFNPNKRFKDDQALAPVPPASGYYNTVALADHAIATLREHKLVHPDDPFFHYLAFSAPHFPLQALPEDIALYDQIYLEGWEVLRARRWQRQQALGFFPGGELSPPERDLGPPYAFPEQVALLGENEVNRALPWKSLTPEQQAFQAKKMAIHAAMVHRMDIEIGRVFEQIRTMGAWENTLVLFLSDNGASAEMMVRDDGHDPAAAPGSAGSYLCLGPGWSTVCNTPFRRHKTWTHEGGIATPMLASWPEGIKTPGEFRTAPGHVIDIVPTLLELTGAKRLPDAPPAPGKSLAPLFQSETEIPRDCLWWFHDGHKAVRAGNWKAVSPEGEPWQLYDLSVDRDESTDLAATQGEQLAALVKAWDTQLALSTEIASQGLDPEPAKKAPAKPRPNDTSSNPKESAKPPRAPVLLQGETFRLNDRPAFLMVPTEAVRPSTSADKPWVFYGPALPAYPDAAESWMHQQFLDAGIAIAGIDVGEAYGSPSVFPHFEALYDEMRSRGYAVKPVLLGRSRGGLWVSSWALAHPDRVAGIAGIYPVYDFTTYPGLKKAAPAYGVSEAELLKRAEEWNPIERGKLLAEAKIPVFVIHGLDDQVVPIAANVDRLAAMYQEAGAGDLITVQRIEGQGHNFWEGFFQCKELIQFVIKSAGP